jgi:hypothetical protein
VTKKKDIGSLKMMKKMNREGYIAQTQLQQRGTVAILKVTTSTQLVVLLLLAKQINLKTFILKRLKMRELKMNVKELKSRREISKSSTHSLWRRLVL